MKRGRYGVSTVGFLRTGIAAYRGPSALVKELVQNADDARAMGLEFRVQADALVVRNDGVFSERDFASIREIASGGKRDDADTTGTWGTGFTSVYQITDRPEIRSAGVLLVLEPLTGEYETGVDERQVAGTEFRFPWRTKETELSRAIEVEPWNRGAIERLHQVLLSEMMQNMLFLRCVDEVVVCDARSSRDTPRETLRVRRKRQPFAGRRHDYRVVTFEITGAGRDAWQGEWTYLAQKAGIPPTRLEAGEAIRLKRNEVELAFGETPPGMPIAGLIHNTLPTPVRTGFRFAINADFYPTADRSGIVMTDDDKGLWNRTLVKALAALTATQLETMRDRSASPEVFYGWLPMQCAAGAEYLQGIVAQAQGAARGGAFAWTHGGWQRPSIARTAASDRVAKLLEPEGSKLADLTPERMDPAVQLYLGVREFGLYDLSLRLKEQLRAGMPLERASPVIADRERLGALLRELQRELAGTETGAVPHPRLAEVLRGLPLALDDAGRLQHMTGRGAAYLVAKGIRPLVPPGSMTLMDEAFQQTYERFYQRFTMWLTVPQLLEALRSHADELRERSLAAAPAYLNTESLLHQLWSEIARAEMNGGLSADHLRGVPILLDAHGVLRAAGGADDPPVLAVDEETALLFAGSHAYLLDSTLLRFGHVLALAGVETVTPAVAARLLAAWCSQPGELSEAPTSINNVNGITAWYRYLAVHAARIPAEQRDQLRRASTVLTSRGGLASAGPDGRLLSLPGAGAVRPAFAVMTHDVDYLVSPGVVTEQTRTYFQDVLGIDSLSAERFLSHHVAPQVARVPASARLEMLRAIRDELLALRPARQLEVIRALQETALLPDQQGVLARPEDVYHPDAELHDVFVSPWRQPAPALGGADDPDEAHAWTQFFSLLDLPLHPLPRDLVRAAREIVASNASDVVRRRQALAILARIDAGWREHYQARRDELAELRDLRWLPAQNREGWFRPEDLLPATFSELVQSQTAVLDGHSRQIGGEFSELLRMPTVAPPRIVIAHLVHLGQSGSLREPSPIYRFLDQPYVLRDAASELRRLADQPVIYHAANQTWYTPRHTFLLDVSAEFGERRLSLPDQQQHLSLFTAMGVRTGVDPVKDGVELIMEVAREAQEANRSGSAVDCVAILRAHRLLLRAQAGGKEAEALRPALAALGDLPCIPGVDQHLHLPGAVFIHDVARVGEWFPGETIPAATVHAAFGSAHEQLLEELGVKRLSQALSHRIVTATAPERDTEWTQLLRTLALPLQRIRESTGGEEPPDWQGMVVERVAKLEVRYRIAGEQWRCESAVTPVEAAYDREGRRLLVTQTVRSNRQLWPMVNEIAGVINPGNPSAVTSALHAVMQLAVDGKGSQIETYLDNAQFRRIQRDVPELDLDVEERSRAVGRIEAAGDDSPPAEDPPAQQRGASAGPLPTRLESGRQLGLSLAQAAPAPPPGAATNASAAASMPGVSDATLVEPPKPPGPLQSPQSVATSNVGASALPTELLPVPAAPELAATAVPAFLGSPEPATPRIPTNWADLAQRFPGAFAAMHGGDHVAAPESIATLHPVSSPVRSEIATPRPASRACQFVLSGTGLLRGFLSLGGGEARALLANDGRSITARTDEEETFPLYIDREQALLYNQTALPEWFERNLIPAGARIGLERESAGIYRIYPLTAPARIVENLRMLEWADGRLAIHSGVSREVTYEIDEAVYRAEIRLEDLAALAAEAIGKKSILEILIDLLAEAATPLSEAWLAGAVQEIRQVAASTVRRELHQSLCFAEAPGAPGHWRFDVAQLASEHARRHAVGLPGSRQPNGMTGAGAWGEAASWPLPGTPAASQGATGWAGTLAALASALEAVTSTQPFLPLDDEWPALNHAVDEFIRAFRRLERFQGTAERAPAAVEEPPEADADASRLRWLLDALRQQHGDEAVFQPEYVALLNELIDAADAEPALRNLFVDEAGAQTLTAWDAVIRPLLDAAAARARERGAYATARWLFELDVQLAGQDRAADLSRLENTELAAGMLANIHADLSDRELASELAQMVRLAPEFEEARVRLRLVATRIAGAAREEIAEYLRREEFDEAYETLNATGEADAQWAAALGQAQIAGDVLESACRELFATGFALAGSADLPFEQREPIARRALLAVQRWVPKDLREPLLRINMVGLLGLVITRLRRGQQPYLALAMELAGWRELTLIAGFQPVGASVAKDRYTRIERLAWRLHVPVVTIAARRKHCERLDGALRRTCYRDYMHMNQQYAGTPEDEHAAHFALLEQLEAPTPEAANVRTILGAEAVEWLQRTPLDSLVL